MQTLHVYSSVPTSTGISLALLGLESLGMQVELRPLSELPAAPRKPCRRRASLRAELNDIRLSLAVISDRLTDDENGTWLLDAGTRQGLLYDRDQLTTRKRTIEGQLGEGGPQG